jgi:hypothetical protein
LLDGKTFPVRRNLWGFLKRKQADDNGHFLWIDAICIDQTSVLERNHQVAMMGRIYAEADDVIAWLGVGPENIITAIRRLNGWSKMSDIKRRSCLPALKAAFVQLKLSSYWTRAWIVQEYLLAKTIRIWCGSETLGDRLLLELNRSLSELCGNWSLELLFSPHRDSKGSKWAPSRMAELMQWRCEVLNGHRKWPSVLYTHGSLDFYNHFGFMACSDVRDRIYALLCIVPVRGKNLQLIEPDYGISPAQLFCELARDQLDDIKRSSRIRTSASYVLAGLRRLLVQLELDDDDDEVMEVMDEIEAFGCESG